MGRVRAVTFDAFGTIVAGGEPVLLRVCERIVGDVLPEVSARRFLERWDALYFARIARDPFLTLRDATTESLERTFVEFRVRADAAGYTDLLQREWLRAEAYPEVPGVLEALDGVPRAVVSNSDDALLKGILERNGLSFDAVLTSEACRAYKPRAEIFEAALRALGVRPREALHVGDSLEADIAGAQRLGMTAAWVNRAGEPLRPGTPAPDLEIPDLRDLLPALGRGDPD